MNEDAVSSVTPGCEQPSRSENPAQENGRRYSTNITCCNFRHGRESEVPCWVHRKRAAARACIRNFGSSLGQIVIRPHSLSPPIFSLRSCVLTLTS